MYFHNGGIYLSSLSLRALNPRVTGVCLGFSPVNAINRVQHIVFCQSLTELLWFNVSGSPTFLW